MSDVLKTIRTEGLENMLVAAGESPRLRSHKNLHDSLEDPIQRLLIAVKRGSYFRPHKHEHKFETLLCLRGRMDVLIFEDSSRLKQRITVGPNEAVVVLEISANTWHTLISLDDEVVFFETKPGPYDAKHPADFAAWAPEENPGSEVVAAFLHKLTNLSSGEMAG